MEKSKIVGYIGMFILVTALCVFIFDLPQYDFFVQLEKVANIDFINPIDELREIITNIASISEWGSLGLQWYEYIVKFYEWVGHFMSIPIIIIKDIALNVFYGLESILIMLGFNL